jgi:RimJ/RimL family protein N-acetyltransferase
MSLEASARVAAQMSTPHADMALARYHTQARHSPLLVNFEAWISELEPARDGDENGIGTGSSRNWLGYQDFLRLQEPDNSLFGTYIQFNTRFGKRLPIGTVTLCKDDRSIRANYNIEATGVWGLFIVHHDYRQKGFATALAKSIDRHIQEAVNKTGQPQDWVTFSGNPIAIKILNGVGFSYERDVTIHQPGYNNGQPSTEQLHRRRYEPGCPVGIHS